MTNLILMTDSYKFSHFNQYPKGAQYVSSYIEARGPIGKWTVFFGLQAFIKKYLSKPITLADIDEAEEIIKAHGEPFNRDGWMRILSKHKGYLPIEIRSVDEGTVMPTSNIQVRVTNTDPELPWIVSFIETALLRAIWYPSTVATLSRDMKGHIYQGLKISSDNPDGQIPFKLHDFGARGVSSQESAMLGGMAHLVNFMGTDTVAALVGARRYYGEPMAGFSIPATEHSTITSWGKEGEIDAYRNLLEQYPTGLVACVSDSYDIWNAARNIWGGVLKDKVMEREGTLVVRPDSGNPTTVVLDVIDILAEQFGYKKNTKGFKVLPLQVATIQGDGMNSVTLPRLIANAVERGISVDNFAMGMGGGLLQGVGRDDLKYAMKASAIYIDGQWRDVYKDPVTDQGKKSKKGVLDLVMIDGEYVTVNEAEKAKITAPIVASQLKLRYYNGNVTNTTTFAEVRERAALK